MSWFASFDAAKLRLKLKIAATRITLTINNKTNEIKKQKQEIANLLKTGNKQIEFARIRTEHLVREDWNVEVLEIIGLLAALVQERTKLLEASAKIPFDMQESCATLCYAANRVDIPELKDIRAQLMLKFKKELDEMLDGNNAKEHVNERVFAKLGVQPPNAFTITQYMKAICEEYKVDWTPPSTAAEVRLDLPAKAPRGEEVTSGAASNITAPYNVTDGTLSSSNANNAVSKTKETKASSSATKTTPPTVLIDPFNSNPFDAISFSNEAPPGADHSFWNAGEKKTPTEEDGTNDFVVLSNKKEESKNLPTFMPPLPPSNEKKATERKNNETEDIPDYDELARRFEALKKGT